MPRVKKLKDPARSKSSVKKSTDEKDSVLTTKNKVKSKTAKKTKRKKA